MTEASGRTGRPNEYDPETDSAVCAYKVGYSEDLDNHRVSISGDALAELGDVDRIAVVDLPGDLVRVVPAGTQVKEPIATYAVTGGDYPQVQLHDSVIRRLGEPTPDAVEVLPGADDSLTLAPVRRGDDG